MKLADGREFDPEEPEGVIRWNIYDCEQGHALLSADLDEGVTPAFVTCPYDRTIAGSRFYNVPPWHAQRAMPVAMVWRKATKGEMKQELRTQGRGGHYASGGLAREWTLPTGVI